MSDTKRPMIEISGVNKYFVDYHALRDINLEIGRGEVVVVLGPSGSGKSTLCRTINRLETIEEGSISIDSTQLPEEGRELAKLRAGRARKNIVAKVPEQPDQGLDTKDNVNVDWHSKGYTEIRNPAE